jgi:hypothetical protein
MASPSGRAVSTSLYSPDTGGPEARLRFAFRISVEAAHRSVATSLSQVMSESRITDYAQPWRRLFQARQRRLFRLTSHEALTSTESCHAHPKWSDVCFPERTKQEALSAAARDWLYGGPENKCAPRSADCMRLPGE